MAYTLWSQDVFSKGELSPLLYSRVSVDAYYSGLKTATNVLTLPQGTAAKRFGTIKLAEVTGFTNSQHTLFEAFQYLNQCVYVLLFKNNAIDIFLEGSLVFTVPTTIADDHIENLDYTILDSLFRVTGEAPVVPTDLVRSSNALNPIISEASNVLTYTNALDVDVVLPTYVRDGTLPAAVPALNKDIVYFLKTITATTCKLYTSVTDAAAGINEIVFSSSGSGSSLYVQNTWNFTPISFVNLPQFDFDGGYDAMTFTLDATTGEAVELTSTGNIFTSNHIGGAFRDGGGIGRITAVGGPTSATVNIISAFADVSILGVDAFLTEPAWSTARGWPQKCSSYQNRSFFCNTALLPNGVWGSYTNGYNNFNDLEDDDDYAISWFPSSDTVNVINFITPYRSFTVHTNSGVFSTPLSSTEAITPKNFSLSLQDSTPADKVPPRTIDNQIVIISGNDVHNLLWDGINNAYTSSIISALNEQLINDPVDEASFVDIIKAGSRYVFIVNADGTLAMLQTLITQNIQGWTPARLDQPYGNAYFRKVTSNFDGRAWFLNEREIAVASAPIAITVYNTADDIFTAVASNFNTLRATACKFIAGVSLPVTSPQIEEGVYYWAIGLTADTFQLYLTQEDANSNTNVIDIVSAGDTVTVEPWPLTQKFYIEELSFDAKVDMATLYNGTKIDTIPNVPEFNAQEVKSKGDGYGFTSTGNLDSVELIAHGQKVPSAEIQTGFPINVVIEPMPLSILTGAPFTTNLVVPKHVRTVTFNFNETIGGQINGIPIALTKLNNTNFGTPPSPATGLFEMSIMKGWDDFNNPTFTITHDEPFDIRLTGVFYQVET